ncbi:MAG: noncanonical pyrimidine nucleotidase, YjjG family [Chitinophagales bacterium]|nr:noncanonical pyrimidine nucleotidase, YjjG family [Chitinophagales bacterium]
MRQYAHVFFDLDETLWDFKRNSVETLEEVLKLYKLESKGVNTSLFSERYHYHNSVYWGLFRKGMIAREELRIIRFTSTLKEFELTDNELAIRMSESYLTLLPTKTKLYDDAHEILSYLQAKYSLHIITNGFEEVQIMKLRNSGITAYFKYVISSEMAGSQKPNREIFKYAFNKTNASVLDSIFIGDSIEADIQGAKSVGMDHVLFNPDRIQHLEQVTYEINALKELKTFL